MSVYGGNPTCRQACTFTSQFVSQFYQKIRGPLHRYGEIGKKEARAQVRTKDQQICNLLRYHCATRASCLWNDLEGNKSSNFITYEYDFMSLSYFLAFNVINRSELCFSFIAAEECVTTFVSNVRTRTSRSAEKN